MSAIERRPPRAATERKRHQLLRLNGIGVAIAPITIGFPKLVYLVMIVSILGLPGGRSKKVTITVFIMNHPNRP